MKNNSNNTGNVLENEATGQQSFKAFSPGLNEFLEGEFFYASDQEIKDVLQLASEAFPLFRKIPGEKRAVFLKAIAEEIMLLGDALIERCQQETGLPAARIIGERVRTCNQLKLFAQLLIDGWWVDARIDTAEPQRQPIPKPDIRRMLVPIGPVAVFGASNFPLAFSTAGGDTASALAAGCPVIVKSHGSHPGTNQLVSSAILKAAKRTGMPEGVFSSICLTHEDVVKFVQDPVIKAVGFTGSRNIGMLLFNAAASRPEPIPVYAEMSAINPVVLLEGALEVQEKKIAKDLVASINLGVGQFCTNPGLIILIENEISMRFLQSLSQEIASAAPGTMLNKNICKTYKTAIKHRKEIPGVSTLAESRHDSNEGRNEGRPVLYTTHADIFIKTPDLSEEIFGPSSLVVLCKDQAEMIKVVGSLEGQLTATIHATERDEIATRAITDLIIQKAGRVIYGGYPTGVEVCHSMQHGGPFPSTTDGRSTSVGTAAIYRFVRPVAFQNFPDWLLPDSLKNKNPLKITRLINGNWTDSQIN